jgi:hypothetical protein
MRQGDLTFFPHKNTAIIAPFGKNAFRFNE